MMVLSHKRDNHVSREQGKHICFAYSPWRPVAAYWKRCMQQSYVRLNVQSDVRVQHQARHIIQGQLPQSWADAGCRKLWLTLSRHSPLSPRMPCPTTSEGCCWRRWASLMLLWQTLRRRCSWRAEPTWTSCATEVFASELAETTTKLLKTLTGPLCRRCKTQAMGCMLDNSAEICASLRVGIIYAVEPALPQDAKLEAPGGHANTEPDC